MAATSLMLPLGTAAPDFTLPSIDGDKVALDDLADAPAVVVVFLSNHCPYVKHVQRGLGDLARDYAQRGVAFVGIFSNDMDRYDDGPEALTRQKDEAGFSFPYLVDESQEVAKAYGAACTPDFFVFDGDRRLVYRGQMDDSRPGSDAPVTGSDLRAALDAVLAGEPVRDEQQPSVGCSIKWKPGNAPDYAGASG
jgi:peroxiredoxin